MLANAVPITEKGITNAIRIDVDWPHTAGALFSLARHCQICFLGAPHRINGGARNADGAGVVSVGGL